jgi:3-deoxy-D-manno-octulosonic-acid transferase
MPERPLPAAAARSLALYNALFPAALIALLPGYLSRLFRRGGFRKHFGQRFGRFDSAEKARFADGVWIWIHSISVGETLLALKLANHLLEFRPDLRIALSVTTTTGFAQAAAAASDRLLPIYNPVDYPPFVRATLDVVRPKQLIFIEAMWPNLLTMAWRRGISVSMIPRLSPRSERRFRGVRWLTGPIFALIDRFYAQDASDVARWSGLGARPESVAVMGNIKFDTPKGGDPELAPLRAVLGKAAIAPNRPVLLGGSTFPGEEAALGRVFLRLRRRIPELFLIVVPRHVERSGEALTDLNRLGLKTVRRSNVAAQTASGNPPDCLLVDTTGELRDWYHLATVVFIGKSLMAEGGQNPVEAVMAGKPVIYGPHMENFQAVVNAWREAEAAVQVADESALEAAAFELLTGPGRRDDLVNRAARVLDEHRGATDRIARAISAQI